MGMPMGTTESEATSDGLNKSIRQEERKSQTIWLKYYNTCMRFLRFVCAVSGEFGGVD